MDLGKYIPLILKEKNRLILPDFGQLILLTNPTKFRQNTNQVAPEHKKVIFSSAYKASDGVLEKYLLNDLGFDKSEAKQEIEKFVSTIKSELADQGKSSIESLGTFHKTQDNKIQFISTSNHSETSEYFGLQEVTFKKIEPKKKEAILSVETNQKDQNVLGKDALKKSRETIPLEKEAPNLPGGQQKEFGKKKSTSRNILLVVTCIFLTCLIMVYIAISRESKRQENQLRKEMLKKIQTEINK